VSVTDEPQQSIFHLHLVSDATGETLNSMAKAACAQFAGIRPLEHIYALVRSQRQLHNVLKTIESQPGIVFYTMMNDALRRELEERCHEMQMPCIAVLDPVLNALRMYLGLEATHKPGGQHDLDAAYFRRIDAMNFSMAHDDGQNTHELDLADVVLVGVSRTSKTPTSIYLANRGIRTANVPIVAGQPLPVEFDAVRQPLIIGLTASPERLVQIRRNRLLSLKEERETDYVDVEAVREEIIHARKLFSKYAWPVIDVSRRSIEETAATILNLFQEHRGGAGIEL
jgi:regulator of PEP synthase PpsR (kinase-PPPase family)